MTSGGTTTRFLYDGPALIAEYDGAGVLQHRTVHGPGVDEPLVWYPPTGRRFLIPDERGSIVAVTDAAPETAPTVNRYDAYGVPAAGNFGRFQYTGQMWIPELALYHYKARVYHPRFGRFLQTDPIGYQDQMNLYAYCRNDPLGCVDPTGTDGWRFVDPRQAPLGPISFGHSAHAVTGTNGQIHAGEYGAYDRGDTISPDGSDALYREFDTSGISPLANGSLTDGDFQTLMNSVAAGFGEPREIQVSEFPEADNFDGAMTAVGIVKDGIANGQRFDILGNNCCTVSTGILQAAGAEIDSSQSIPRDQIRTEQMSDQDINRAGIYYRNGDDEWVRRGLWR